MLKKILVLVIILAAAFFIFRDKIFPGKKGPNNSKSGVATTKTDWLDWNILFSPTQDNQKRQQHFNTVKKDVIAYLDSIKNVTPGFDYNLVFKIDSCKCDTLLYHIGANIDLWGATGSTTTPPPKTDPGASGDKLGYILADNDLVTIPEEFAEYAVFDTARSNHSGTSVQSMKLAIIDTGLDSLLFAPGLIKRIQWQDGKGLQKNFLIGGKFDDDSDDSKTKHGSAVADLALRQFTQEQLPALMVLKALDAKGKGSVFTVSCALSFAAQHRATVINASLGYYGTHDNILYRYVQRAEDSSAVVIAAAGNRPGAHAPETICNPRSLTDNPLGPNNMFYPACFADEFISKHLITVTGVKSSTEACFHQNFSNAFVDIGVISRRCCSYKAFFTNSIEGSSFATPYVSGRVGRYLIEHPGIYNKSDLIRNIKAIPDPTSPIIRGGNTIKE